jgi:glycosyltransferase involved in cell wall biosynthesis
MFKKIVVCSNTHKIWTNKTYGISNSRITVYHNCVDINKFDTVKEENYTIFDKPKVDFLFCAVGTLGRGVNKRMDINIKSIIQLNKIGYDVGLVICGDGDQKVELQELIDESNLNHKIKLLGNRPDVKNILSRCDAFCHAAPYEPFGIVAIEAMAMQLAVILPNSGGIKEILDDENGGGFLYEALNVEEQMEKMKLLLDNKDNTIVIGKQARKNVEDNFSSAHYMQRFMNEFY